MVNATLTFLGEKFTVLSELAGEGGGLLLGRRVVIRGLLSLLLVLLVIGTSIRLLLVVQGGLGGGGGISVGVMGILGRHSNGIVFLPFLITAINLQGEIAKFGEAFVSREMKEVILDTFGQAPVGNVPECCIIPLSLG